MPGLPFQQHLIPNQSPILHTPSSATGNTASVNMPSSAACTYHPSEDTYTCDPKQSAAIIKEGLQQALETANTIFGEYCSSRVLPVYEAHPWIAGCVTFMKVWFVMKRHGWTLTRVLFTMLMLGVWMVVFHALDW